jgi:hypothetical protein
MALIGDHPSEGVGADDREHERRCGRHDRFELVRRLERPTARAVSLDDDVVGGSEPRVASRRIDPDRLGAVDTCPHHDRCGVGRRDDVVVGRIEQHPSAAVLVGAHPGGRREHHPAAELVAEGVQQGRLAAAAHERDV